MVYFQSSMFNLCLRVQRYGFFYRRAILTFRYLENTPHSDLSGLYPLFCSPFCGDRNLREGEWMRKRKERNMLGCMLRSCLVIRLIRLISFPLISVHCKMEETKGNKNHRGMGLGRRVLNRL